jgi:hypothetical protein
MATPILLPLLLLLPLFLLRVNREAAAWWIWGPLGVTGLLGIPFVTLIGDEIESLPGVFYGFLAGLGAAWLLSPWLGSRLRVGVFIKTLLLLAAVGIAGYLPAVLSGWGRMDWLWPYMMLLIASGSLIVALGLAIAACSVQRRFALGRFTLVLACCLLLGWTAFYTILWAAQGSAPDWGRILIIAVITSGVTLGMLLPLLLLSFLQPFYRRRFAAWLNLELVQQTADRTGAPTVLEAAQTPRGP